MDPVGCLRPALHSLGRVVDLVTSTEYRERHLRDISDMPPLQHDLLEAVRCAALN
jgi:hypothetical protein